jgi:hypothetical protein
MAIMPRVNPYSVLGASTLNTVFAEVESQGRTCRVRRTGSQSIASSARTPVSWQLEDWDTNGGGMWNPATPQYQTVQVAGTYLILGQVRFDDLGGVGSVYRAGMRNAYITVNSTDPSGTACKGANSLYAGNSLNGEGQTLQVHAKEALQPGDKVYLIVSQDCGSTIVGCHQTFGGTFFDLNRLSAIA